MLNKKSFYILMIMLLMIALILPWNIVWAEEEEEPAGDEEGTFISVAPDALIVLDLSGSMRFNPNGLDGYVYGNSTSCTPSTTYCNYSDCTGGFCNNSHTSCNVNCSRLSIAKRALFNILDNDNNNLINSADMDSLGIRIGYMRFYNCSNDDTGNSYSSGCNSLVTTISTMGSDTGTSYSKTYCGNSSSCTSGMSSCTSGSCIVGASSSGGTPIATALKEAKLYLDAHKAADPSKSCRQKFVVLVTDGADTFACSGDGTECQEHMYKRRREVVAKTKTLYNAGYKVFIIGFGSGMPAYLTNTLNWMAYHGGTDNTLLPNSGSTSAYSIPSGASYPTGISGCTNDTSNETATCYSAGSSTNTDHFKSTNNDPGYLSLSGYAFIATTSDELTKALQKAMMSIRAATYSFTQSSIQAVRTIDENYVYEASFEPQTLDPFWIGHLKRYPINADGYITSAADWDAGAVLQSRSATSRTVLTTNSMSATLKTFNASITQEELDVTTEARRLEVINFTLGGEQDSSYTYYGWKLGDIFHTSPLSIATPNKEFYDVNDKNSAAFESFRTSHQRTVSNSGRIIVVGANDGQLHAFRALDGFEKWSFIPPNLLSELHTIDHDAHDKTLTEHNYFVDGPLSAADYYTAEVDISSTTAKSSALWKTILVMNEGRGGMPTLWSSSANCNTDFNRYYSSTYNKYCGIYALDVTDTTADPFFKWRLGGNSTSLSADIGSYLGQSWSKMYLGRIRDNNKEKWVGFVGGGYSGTNCAGATCDTRGKGFFVVDLNNGSILWKYTNADNGSMDYDLAAGPTVVDYDSDGFLDTAYVGDLGGNIWRFKFCLASEGENCTISSWNGSLLYMNPTPADTNKAIYTNIAVAFDDQYNFMVYAGTGNKTDPTGTTSKGRVLAIRDSDPRSTYTLSNLKDCKGWYYDLAANGEKILAEPVVYDRKVYFTSYLPATSSDACSVAGSSKLYILDYKCGGVLATVNISTGGISSAPVVSINPTTGTKDIYVSMSEEAISSTKVHTLKISDPTQDTPSKTLRYWKDMRVQ